MQDVFDLVGRNRIRSTAKRGHLNHLRIRPVRHPLGRGVQSVTIAPLGEDIDVFQRNRVFIQGNGCFRDDIDSQFRQQIRDTVVDKRIHMIGSAGKNNRCPSLGLRLAQHGFRL